MELEMILACCVPIIIGLIFFFIARKENKDSKKRKIK